VERGQRWLAQKLGKATAGSWIIRHIPFTCMYFCYFVPVWHLPLLGWQWPGYSEHTSNKKSRCGISFGNHNINCLWHVRFFHGLRDCSEVCALVFIIILQSCIIRSIVQYSKKSRFRPCIYRLKLLSRELSASCMNLIVLNIAKWN